MSENPSPHATVTGSTPPPDASQDGDRQGMARTSEILRRSIAARASDRAAVAQQLAPLGAREFGLLIVLLVLPALIPGPPVPFYSLQFAAAVAQIASQL